MCLSGVLTTGEKVQVLVFKDRAISKRINESPIRLDRAVNIPPASAVGD